MISGIDDDEMTEDADENEEEETDVEQDYDVVCTALVATGA